MQYKNALVFCAETGDVTLAADVVKGEVLSYWVYIGVSAVGYRHLPEAIAMYEQFARVTLTQSDLDFINEQIAVIRRVSTFID